MRIVFAGSIAFDYLMTFPGFFKDFIHPDKIDDLSLSFLVDGMTRHRGGVAPNIAYTFALLGGEGTVLGAAGAEDFGDYMRWLAEKNIDVSGIKLIDGAFTASFFANTDRANSQIASFFPGAMSQAQHCRIADLNYRPDMVVVSADDPLAMQAHVREARALGIPYVYDPSQQLVRMQPDEVREGVEGAHMLVVNEYEMHVIARNLDMSLEQILDHVAVCVVTLGKKGVRVHAGGDTFEAPAAEAGRILDPTGAGDAFRGGFLRGVAAGLDWETCAKLGSLSAVYCIEAVGTQNHAYTLEDFQARYIASYGERAPLDKLTT